MTEPLVGLLHRVGDDETVPLPDAEGIVRRAHRMRRRRRLGEATVAATVCGALAVGWLVVAAPHAESEAQERYASAPAAAAYRAYGAFASGPTVYIGNHEVTFEDKIKSVYYTSVGVVVRHGNTATSDDPGPSRYELIRPDGTHSDLDLDLGDRIPGTSPDSPYFTFARPAVADGTPPDKNTDWQLVVVDLRTGGEIADQYVSGAFTWGGWAAPPVTTSGDRMWALLDAGWIEFDWRAGTTRLVPGTRNDPIEAGGGRYVRSRDHESGTTWSVHSFDDPTLVLKVDLGGGVAWLSPDGRIVRVDEGMAGFGPDGRVLDYPGPSRFIQVDTGRSVSIPGKRFYGWTPDGNALSVNPQKDEVTYCDTVTGHCDVIHRSIRDANPGRLKLGGALYES